MIKFLFVPGIGKKRHGKQLLNPCRIHQDRKFFETLETADFGRFKALPNGRVALLISCDICEHKLIV